MLQTPAALAPRRSASLPLGTAVLLPLLCLGLACGGGGGHQPAATPAATQAAPRITGVEPAAGPAGSEFLVRGTDFLGVTAVRLAAGDNTLPAVVLAQNPTELRLRVPADTPVGPRSLTVVAAAGDSGPAHFTFTVAAAPASAPVILSALPASGAPGTVVTLRGEHLEGVTAVHLVGPAGTREAQIAHRAPTQLSLAIPADAPAGSHGFTLTTASATTSYPEHRFEVVLEPGQPTATAIDPPLVRPGTQVRITGQHLDAVHGVGFTDGVAHQRVTLGERSATSLSLPLPNLASGLWEMYLINARDEIVRNGIRVTVQPPEHPGDEDHGRSGGGTPTGDTGARTPVMESVEPYFGLPGDYAVVTGQHLDAVQAVQLSHDGVDTPVPLFADSATRLRFQVPQIDGGQAYGIRFTVAGAPSPEPGFVFVVLNPEGNGTERGTDRRGNSAEGPAQPAPSREAAAEAILPRAQRAALARQAAEAEGRRQNLGEYEAIRRGALAEAQVLGASRAEAAAASHLAIQALRERRGTREGAEAGHREAVAALRRNLDANHTFVGADRAVFNLTDAYRDANWVLQERAGAPRVPGRYYINYDYVAADPYLIFHNEDIHASVPEPVSDDEWTSISNTLLGVVDTLNRFVPPENLDNGGHRGNLQHVLGVINGSGGSDFGVMVKKRIKRLFLEVQSRTANGEVPPVTPGMADVGITPTAELAYQISLQAEGRCIEGIAQGLNAYENAVFESGGGGAPVNMGEFISMVLTDYKMAFIARHRALNARDREFPTMVEQTQKMKMLYALGLRGHYAPVFLAGYRGTNASPTLDADRIMARFLDGARGVRIAGGDAAVDFDAYNVDKMVDLLQQARRRGLTNVAGNQPLVPPGDGLSLKLLAIKREAVDPETGVLDDETLMPAGYEVRDPVLGPAWNRFESPSDGSRPYSVSNEYFEPAPAGEHELNFRLTRAFWLHELEKYGYIVRAPGGAAAATPPAATTQP